MNDTLKSAEVTWTFTCFMGACENFHWIWVKWYNTHNLGGSVLASLLPAGHVENIYIFPRNPLGKEKRNHHQWKLIGEIIQILSSEYFFKGKWPVQGYKKISSTCKMWMPFSAMLQLCKTNRHIESFNSKSHQKDQSLLDFISPALF